MTIWHGSNSPGILKEKSSITSYPSNGSTGGISLELLVVELDEDGILDELVEEELLILLELLDEDELTLEELLLDELGIELLEELELLGVLVVLLSCLEDEVVELLDVFEVVDEVLLLSSLDVVVTLSFVLSLIKDELKLDELVTTPTLHEDITNEVNNAKALKTCLFFITP